ncbi:hypothetical protein GOV11_02580 [Candidatus Woesearchaeota archaeon]|nr:hypothetical protein [Candidatus Woesearchaeota archaeon]
MGGRYKTLFIARDRDISKGNASNELIMAYAAHKRGHEVYLLEPEDFYVENNKLYGITRRPNALNIPDIAYYARCLRDTEGLLPQDKHFLKEEMSLEDFDIVVSRVVYRNHEERFTFDNTLGYLSALQTLHPEVAIINDPNGILKAGSKVYDSLLFPSSTPRTHISSNLERITKLIEQEHTAGNRLVGKPLDGHGGENVMIIPETDFKQYAANLVSSQGGFEKKPAIFQQRITGSDRRIFLLNGDPVGAYIKEPAKGDVRANISQGGIPTPYELQDVDVEISNIIKDKLVKDGLYFCGLDIMGPKEGGTLDNTKILEVNVRCPSGIIYLDKKAQDKIMSDFMDLGEHLADENRK